MCSSDLETCIDTSIVIVKVRVQQNVVGMPSKIETVVDLETHQPCGFVAKSMLWAGVDVAKFHHKGDWYSRPELNRYRALIWCIRRV